MACPVHDTVTAPWNDAQRVPLIRLEQVTKRFGAFTAVDRVDLSIYRGEFFALLGPSGCGKTTLMRILAGFEAANEGLVALDGCDMTGIPPNKRPINMMFQSYALFPHLTVAENIAFGLKRSNMPKSEIQGRVEEMLKLVQLTAYPARKPHQISGGQRQRVALARALAKSPKLLLLDEPMAALDKKLRQETQFELMDIQGRTGTTFVIVTHDQEEAMTVASRVAVMDHGRVVQVGTPNRVYEMPKSSFVAGFIGDVNLLEGKVKLQSEGFAALHWADGQNPFFATPVSRLRAGAHCRLAVRPEKIAITAEKPEGPRNVIRGKVHDIAYLGNLSTYHVELATQHIMKVQISNDHRLPQRSFARGDEVWLSWADGAGLILDE